MLETALPMLSGWESFYVIVGSSGAALIGLQFVVIAVVKDTRTRTNSGALSAFATPTVVHLGGALLISAVMSAPWESLNSVGVALAIVGLAGIVYGAGVVREARRQTGYAPVLEDWLWHTLFPFAAYGTVALSALLLRVHTKGALFAIGWAALGLLFIAIHNAWDSVAYLVISAQEREARSAGETRDHGPETREGTRDQSPET